MYVIEIDTGDGYPQQYECSPIKSDLIPLLGDFHSDYRPFVRIVKLVSPKPDYLRPEDCCQFID